MKLFRNKVIGLSGRIYFCTRGDSDNKSVLCVKSGVEQQPPGEFVNCAEVHADI